MNSGIIFEVRRGVNAHNAALEPPQRGINEGDHHQYLLCGTWKQTWEVLKPSKIWSCLSRNTSLAWITWRTSFELCSPMMLSQNGRRRRYEVKTAQKALVKQYRHPTMKRRNSHGKEMEHAESSEFTYWNSGLIMLRSNVNCTLLFCASEPKRY